MVGNSLSKVIGRDGLRDLLSTVGLTTEQIVAFLKLVAADVNQLGHLDLQYRPFLAVNPSTVQVGDEIVTPTQEVVYAPAVVASANILPNVQRAHSIRSATNAQALVAVVADHIKTLFPRVRTNCAISLGTLETDADIVALGEDTLYLFECKHSMTPTGAHEIRDLWTDINKGVSQVERAVKILRAQAAQQLRRATSRSSLSPACVETTGSHG